jgi:DNA mismatch repair protein MutL
VQEETEIVLFRVLLVNLNLLKKIEENSFVNDRYIKSGYLHHAVMAAYDGILRRRTTKLFFIFDRCQTQSILIYIPLKQR